MQHKTLPPFVEVNTGVKAVLLTAFLFLAFIVSNKAQTSVAKTINLILNEADRQKRDFDFCNDYTRLEFESYIHPLKEAYFVKNKIAEITIYKKKRPDDMLSDEALMEFIYRPYILDQTIFYFNGAAKLNSSGQAIKYINRYNKEEPASPASDINYFSDSAGQIKPESTGQMFFGKTVDTKGRVQRFTNPNCVITYNYDRKNTIVSIVMNKNDSLIVDLNGQILEKYSKYEKIAEHSSFYGYENKWFCTRYQRNAEGQVIAMKYSVDDGLYRTRFIKYNTLGMPTLIEEKGYTSGPHKSYRKKTLASFNYDVTGFLITTDNYFENTTFRYGYKFF